ncbi:pectinesterase family protein [Anaeromicropila populeti]|uniref:GDSL-like Lipase/Acylhydrolase family protein n=1 Tax=Anaeromicropila populeti TaxID=37658 RepID=A0A1I6K658_9FIRM|nr:pectinesterase family protein [Anaeromicropila populeti]SFR86558.1 GDSL-like Lipase/Acylhydrolase family protein [Anaeromicropila populeti]
MKKKLKRGISAVMAILMLLTVCLGDFMWGETKILAANGRKVDVWDFGGVQETNEEIYTNNIQAADWNDAACVVSGKFVAVDGTTEMGFGDLSITYTANDRLYINDPACTKSYGSYGLSTYSFSDGYTSNGIYYCNGTGGESRRCLTISNVNAGDRITVYMGSSNAVTGQLFFKYLGSDGEQLVEEEFSNTPGRYDFVADFDGSYKIYAGAAAGKPIYYRAVRTPGILVSGTIELGDTNPSGYTVSFTNNTTGKKTEAVLNGMDFQVILAPGYTYTAVLSGAVGFGFTAESKLISPVVEEVLSGKTGVILEVEEKTTYSYTGSIVGFDSEYDKTNLAIEMKPEEGAAVDPVILTIGQDLTFNGILEPDVEYQAVMTGVNDYQITSGGMVNSSTDVVQDIEVVKKQNYQVTGSFVNLPDEKTVSNIEFINEEDGYRYSGTASADGYVVQLRNGAYSVEATVDGYVTHTHVVVNSSAVTKNLFFVSTDTTITPIERVSDVYVGYSEKAHNYDTVKEAVAACKAMNPSSEAERITVHIAPGVYREQIIIETPYLSFVNDEPEKEVKLTWYYGIGYQYYSADSTGYYNEENAFDQYKKAIAAKWGVATYVKGTATAFRAENITFEASFNRYITDEEIADGVEISGSEAISFERKYGVDVASKKATERATALCVDADYTEFYNCSFLGSQDTLYTGSGNTNGYYKNCFIEGNTDYIFGDGDVLFDGCELSFYGYTEGSTSAYLTAARPDNAPNGYMFRNCSITANTEEGFTVSPSYFGRPWGASARVAFLNTKLAYSGLILDAGWTSMSGNAPENANYVEYNTTSMDGSDVNISGRTAGVVSEEPAFSLSGYFDGWVPSYYLEDNAELSFSTVPYLIDNGDMNAPYPGHKLTAGYALGDNDKNDASVIRWYRVDQNGVETLVKSSTALVDKTYTITADDIGNYIKVVVIPETISGKKATEKSSQLEALVRDGYENPEQGTGDIELGDGVNIFLAGDSTVKDYSAKGMYNGGTALSMGSWGEYLQSFFDSSSVKVINYANGGRSSRSFINEGSLDKIKENLDEGDYLFIQFGHNDCSNSSGYLEDRYVPLGTPDANGIYPVTAGTEVATPSSLLEKYGDTFYSYDCGGTYKWYLSQYIQAAKDKGAIPVLVTPVSRMYYDENGTIKAHHDSTDATTATQVTTDNAYVTAVKQLAEEENVLLIDGFELTKKMYEEAYKADPSAANGVSGYGTLLMAAGEKTHSSKLGGFISAAYIAQNIQTMSLNISHAIKIPAQVLGENTDGSVLFTVNGSGQLTAYEMDADGNYTSVVSQYWTNVGQNLIQAIGSYEDEPEVPVKHTIWVIGDSTVSAFSDSYYYPRYGWGTQLDKYFDSNAFEVKNLAISGTSSKSFTTSTEYQTLLAGMAEGDYLFIGFGHNDEKTEAERFTNPNGTYLEAGTFANSLYENYVKLAKDKGCTTILCTPIVRRTATGVWSDSQLHVTAASGDYEGGDYSQAIRNLGTALNIPVVDMTTLTKNLYDSLGASETIYLHAWTSSNQNSVDNTHTNIWGAFYNAYFIAKTIKELNISGLSEYVITSQIASAPTKAVYLVSNPDYVEKGYDSNLPDSQLWTDCGVWKGTVFGDIGGVAPSTDNFVLTEMPEGNINIAVKNNKGKIASSVDGLAMYYYKVPVGSQFTISATATVNSFALNDQVSFGLMARDEMYIDTYLNGLLGDYVAAAPLKLTKTGSVWNCFARKSGVLTQGGTCANTISAGDTIDLKIQSNSDGYACTFGKEQTITAGFDFQLTSIDSEYIYVGMFAARNADVTFSNIKLIVDGVLIAGEEEPVQTPTPKPTKTPKPSTTPTTSTTPTPSTMPTPSTTPTPSITPEPTKIPTRPEKPVIDANLQKGKGNAIKTYTYKPGSKVKTLKVSATGENVTYQWFYNTANKYKGAKAITGATAASYTPSGTATGTRYYFVKISSNDTTKDIEKVTVYSRKVKVTIVKPVTKIAVEESSVLVNAKDTVTLSATVYPSTATNKKLIYTSSNTKYATVSEDGVITTKAAGRGKTVTITVRSKDNRKCVKKVEIIIK